MGDDFHFHETYCAKGNCPELLQSDKVRRQARRLIITLRPDEQRLHDRIIRKRIVCLQRELSLPVREDWLKQALQDQTVFAQAYDALHTLERRPVEKCTVLV